jgi:zinc D-Ala-D-Ala dipeptidase
MWDVVKGTSKYMYVSNPSRGGGLHNYGLAVDISIADSLGHPLPMGTEVDYMDAASHITNEAKLVREGKITQQERENRILLRQVMKSAGFRALPSEWWHFNLCSRDEAKQKYKLIN